MTDKPSQHLAIYILHNDTAEPLTYRLLREDDEVIYIHSDLDEDGVQHMTSVLQKAIHEKVPQIVDRFIPLFRIGEVKAVPSLFAKEPLDSPIPYLTAWVVQGVCKRMTLTTCRVKV